MTPLPPEMLSDILLIVWGLYILIQERHSHGLHPLEFWRDFCLKLFLSLEMKYTNKMRLCAPVKREILKYIFSWRSKISQTDTNSFSARLTGRWWGRWANSQIRLSSKTICLSPPNYTGVWAESVVLFWGSFLDNEKGGNILIFEYLKRTSERRLVLESFNSIFSGYLVIKTQKSTNNSMSSFGLIEKNMELSHI